MLPIVTAKEITEERELLIAKFNDARIKVELNEEEEDVENLKDAFRELDAVTTAYESMGDVSTLALGLMLYDQKKIFDSLPIPILEDLMPKGYSKNGMPSDLDDAAIRSFLFKQYCKQKRRRSLKTIYGYLRVGEVFLSGEVELDYPKGLKPNWWDINHSNLLVAAGRAAAGNLSDEAWELLADPETSQDKLIEAIKAGDENPSDDSDPDKSYFSIEDGVVYWLDRTSGEMVGFAAFDDSEEELVLAGMEAFEAFMSKSGFPVKGLE